MDYSRILNIFTRGEKTLLGVCSRLSRRAALPPVAIRVVFILVTLLFMPLGIMLYLAVYLLLDKRKNKVVVFGILGALLGVPLSYYFQSDVVKNWGGEGGGIFSYMKNFTETVEQYNRYIDNGAGIIYNMILSIIVFASIGVAIGYRSNKKTPHNKS